MAALKNMYTRLEDDPFPEDMTIILGNETLVYKKRSWNINNQLKGLRYGENPGQPAALYQLATGQLTIGGIAWAAPDRALVAAIDESHMLQAGKHPGKTNLTDVDNGANILQYLAAKPACVIIKHNNPCGAAWDDSIEGAVTRAFWSDRIAAFGGAVIVNTCLDMPSAELLADNYFEVIAAPAYAEGTVELLKSRKNLRILELPGLAKLDELRAAAWLDIKSLADGGLIVQKSFQSRILDPSDFLPAIATAPDGLEVTTRAPTRQELQDLLFAWGVEAGVTSNSVVFAKNGATVAIGAGEQDRVGCVELAIHKAYVKYADQLAYKELGLSLYDLRLKAKTDATMQSRLEELELKTKADKGGLEGSRLVSDGFFPFRDGVDAAIAQGVTAIAHPGGSLRDYESIIACNEAVPQVAMVFTGQRSFKH